jgi:hypothetical protein
METRDLTTKSIAKKPKNVRNWSSWASRACRNPNRNVYVVQFFTLRFFGAPYGAPQNDNHRIFVFEQNRGDLRQVCWEITVSL